MTYFFTECFKAMYVLVKLTPSITKLRKINLKLVFERLIVFVKVVIIYMAFHDTYNNNFSICCIRRMRT